VLKSCCALALVLVACGDNHSKSGPSNDAPPQIVVDAPDPPDAGDPVIDPACAAPFVVTPDPAAEANATAALTALAPTATLTWAPVRNTLQSIDGLVITLPTCVGSTNAFDLLFDTLDASPALFQIDRTEWNTGVEPCSDILANGFHTLIIRRNAYGPYPLENDVFSAVADVHDGVAILRNFSGTYVPKPSNATLEALERCSDFPSDKLHDALLVPPFTYTEFAPPPADACSIAGTAQYTASTNDELVVDPARVLQWTEDGTSITLLRQGTATLTVAPADYGTTLEQSSANCVDDNDVSHVGWVRTFNAVTAAKLYDHDSPDPFCTVCLRD
jgi:hypothetical protein